MKKSYAISVEEVTTCNGCLFTRWSDDLCTFHCELTNIDIDDHMYQNTKCAQCPLTIA